MSLSFRNLIIEFLTLCCNAKGLLLEPPPPPPPSLKFCRILLMWHSPPFTSPCCFHGINTVPAAPVRADHWLTGHRVHRQQPKKLSIRLYIQILIYTWNSWELCPCWLRGRDPILTHPSFTLTLNTLPSRTQYGSPCRGLSRSAVCSTVTPVNSRVP